MSAVKTGFESDSPPLIEVVKGRVRQRFRCYSESVAIKASFWWTGGVEPDKKLLRAFGLAVRQAREKEGISQDVLAELAGLHRTYIGSVERGERNLTLKNISAVAAALNMRGSALLERAEGFLGGRGTADGRERK